MTLLKRIGYACLTLFQVVLYVLPGSLALACYQVVEKVGLPQTVAGLLSLILLVSFSALGFVYITACLLIPTVRLVFKREPTERQRLAKRDWSDDGGEA